MTDRLKVLIVEDSPADCKLVLQELKRAGKEVEWDRVQDAQSMRDALINKSWDVVISDWAMPKFSATEALRLVKEAGIDVPFIIVSGTVGEEQAVEAMRAGAHDYVLKDKLTRLVPAIEREVRESRVRESRRRAESSLLKSETRFARLAESGIVGINIADIHGNLHEANDAYLKMIGYTREDLLTGKLGWGDMTPPEWKAGDEKAVAQLQAEGVAQPWEKELIRKDGTRIPILVGVAMLDFPNCIAFLVDLTAQKAAERALVRSEERLVQAQKMEAIGSLAGGVAHDFNNLLSVILSYSSMLASDLQSGDPMRDDLGEIQMAARRAADLTRQLLAFSRQQVLQPRLVNLNDIVVQIEKMIRRLIGEDIELTAVPSAVGKVLVDPGQVEQVIMNLAVNSRDAMPRGGKLLIETMDIDLDEAFAAEHIGVIPGPHVMLAVTDTGVGMDRATQARIFEPFYTTKEVGKGTGLGLSTVFGIVKQSAGTIWVYSELGRGTTFKIYFPRADAAAINEQAGEEIAPSSLRGSETILLVEDEEQVRSVAKTILQRFGYHVLEAQSGGDALLICEQHPVTIHLMVSDVVMPRMSGRQLAERLRSVRPMMKVLFMSGYTDSSIIHHGVLDSDIAFLQKPITPDTLTKKVRQVLDAPARRGGAS
jgi:hypothetical protein